MFDYTNIYNALKNDYQEGAIEQILSVADRLQGYEAYQIRYSSESIILYFMEWYYLLYAGADDPKQAAKTNRGCSGCLQKSLAFMSGLIKFLDAKRKEQK